jgi:hypothetical protein
VEKLYSRQADESVIILYGEFRTHKACSRGKATEAGSMNRIGLSLRYPAGSLG